jgi:uncharacterized protein
VEIALNKAWMMILFSSLLCASDALPPDYSQWKQQRDSSLRAEGSWLTLVGLHWIEPGTFTLGSGADQAIRLASGPAVLGSITRSKDDQLTLKVLASDVYVDEKPASGTVQLQSDHDGHQPTEVRVGRMRFFAIDRGGRIGLRVKDSAAAARTQFAGIDYFEYAAGLNVAARYEAYPKPRMLDVATIIGTVEPTLNPGRAHFTLFGKPYSFELLKGSDAQHYFTIFGDKTNGKETYGMARFLTGQIDHAAGTVQLDFNRAYNPPCAFTEFATCPMPPAGNRIAARVEAGEKAYRTPE